jgi:hypothetical protein
MDGSSNDTAFPFFIGLGEVRAINKKSTRHVRCIVLRNKVDLATALGGVLRKHGKHLTPPLLISPSPHCIFQKNTSPNVHLPLGQDESPGAYSERFLFP